jgi:hypothetical protein
MTKKNLTAAEKRYYAKVAELGCYVGVHFPKVNAGSVKACGGYINIHHALIGKPRSNKRVIPLCTNHHVEQTPLPFGYAVHKGTKSFEEKYGTQEEMLEWVEANV